MMTLDPVDVIEDHCRRYRQMEATIRRIEGVIKLAEDWNSEQVIPENEICKSALKEIRRIIGDTV